MADNKPNATEGAVKLAAEKGVDLNLVWGTGTDGRITKNDVESYLHDRPDVWEDTPTDPTQAGEIKLNGEKEITAVIDPNLAKIQDAPELVNLHKIVARLQKENIYTPELQAAVRDRAKAILQGNK